MSYKITRFFKMDKIKSCQSCKSCLFSQTHNSFHVVSLGEQIERSDRINDISVRDELLQVACKRRRIAGDVRDLHGVKIQNAFDYSRLSACSRRIEQDEINLIEPRIPEPVRNSRSNHARVA